MGFDAVLDVRLLLTGLALLIGLLAALTWNRRADAPAATSYALLLVAAAIYIFGYGEEIAQTTLSSAIFWWHIQFLAVPWIPALWLLTAFRHNGVRFSAPWLFVVPAVCSFAYYTNDWHHLYGTGLRLVQHGPFQILTFDRGPFSILLNGYLLLVFLVGPWPYLTRFREGSPLFRRQAIIFVAAAAFPIVCYFVSLAGLSPWHLDIATVSMAVSGILYYYGLFRVSVFDLSPLARNLVFHGMRDAVLILDTQHRLLDFNPAATALFPFLTRSSIGEQTSHLLAGYPQFLDVLTRAGSEEVILDSGAECLYFHIRTFHLLVEQHTLGNASILADVTTQTHLREELRLHAQTDPLTGIANRRRFLAALEQECANSGRSQAVFSLLLLDLDHFKSINDRFGHPVGDSVLIETAERLQRCLRGSDLLCRFGGEEFAILLPAADSTTAALCAERLRSIIGEEPVQVDELSLSLTISIGVVTRTREQADVRRLLQEADTALYRAKAEGRNRVVIDE